MNNASLNLDSIRQPTPSVVGENSSKNSQSAPSQIQKKINYPNVGVADVPVVSKTPIGDTLVIKKQENPKITYKLSPKYKNCFCYIN